MKRHASPVLLFVFAAAFISGAAEAANIVGIFTSLGPSHLIVHMSVAKVLAEHGHNVTVVTSITPKVTHKDINVITVPLSAAEEREWHAAFGQKANKENQNMLVTLFGMLSNMKFMLNKMFTTLKDPRVVDLYENKSNKFDLVIIGYFMNQYQLGIAHKLKAPVVMVASMPPMELLGQMLGNPRELSYVPAMNRAVKRGHTMTFMQRLFNYVESLGMRVFQYILDGYNSNFYQMLYGDDPNMPAYKDLPKNISLVFFNSHAHSEGPIRPNVPGVIEIGGIQVKEQPAPLPENMAKFLNEAPHGAILLSLGSNLKGAHLKPETVQKMFNVLSKLQQRVLWKWEDLEKTPGKSANILYSKWLPQDDILAHPNIKLFITHAGKGGISEAQYHGKPMLALPVFGDQPFNAEKMVQNGFGLSLKLLELQEEQFRDGILQVLQHPQYAENVKRFSALYRDRPMTAHQTVLYWTEYVLRHHGAPHLQSPRLHMCFVAVYNLDVYALLLTVLFLLLLILKWAVTCALRKFRGKCNSKPSKKAANDKQKKH